MEGRNEEMEFRAGLNTAEGGDCLTEAEMEELIDNCDHPFLQQDINLETNLITCRRCGFTVSLNPLVEEKLRVQR